MRFRVKSIRSLRGMTLIKAVGVALVLMFACVGVLAEQASLEQQDIANNVLRFHVLANSDSSEDQALKLEVRDAVIGYVQGLGGTDLEGTKSKILANLSNIEDVARKVVTDNGFDYDVVAKLGSCEFPTKQYGDISLPSGIYDALNIEIGAAKGHNWWCVVYPNICFVETGAVLTDEAKAQLRGVIGEDEYALISGKRPIRFRIIELMQILNIRY